MDYDVTETYPTWYQEGGAEPELKPAWDWVASCLVAEFPLANEWCDVGCGPGRLVQSLQNLGRKAWGIEGSKDAKGILPDVSIVEWDLRYLFPLKEKVDIATCFDVAEHVGAAEVLVQTLTSLSVGWIIFGAAPPGQDGHGHIDLKPPEEWEALFLKRGWKVCKDLGNQVKVALRSNDIHSKIWWVEKNLQVFTWA